MKFEKVSQGYEISPRETNSSPLPSNVYEILIVKHIQIIRSQMIKSIFIIESGNFENIHVVYFKLSVKIEPTSSGICDISARPQGSVIHFKD